MDYFLGEIQLFPYGWAPYGFRICNGDTLAIVQNQALYSLIGCIFGGDGRTNFKIPNLTNASVPNMSYYICIAGFYPIRP
jgi:microcystin-dependent protein